MTRILVREKLENARIIGPGEIIENVDLDRCSLVGSAAIQRDDPNPSLILREINAHRCTIESSSAIGVRFENVNVNHLMIRGGILYLVGCVFSHVKLTGSIGPLMAVPPAPRLGESAHPNAHEAIAEAYSSIDWALDISEAEFSEADMYYIPGGLVRRDPDTQFLLRRDRLMEVDRQTIPTGAEIFLRRFEETPFDSIIAIAPKRSDYFQEILEILKRLRSIGIAE